MALLHLLVTTAPGLDVYAAHFDHGLRAESSAEARSVSEWSSGLGIECTIGRPPETLTGGGQAEFRRHRYNWLLDVCRRLGADRLATGHHADDQAETVLIRVLRGTGLRGMGGIPRRRGVIVRPLLDCTRAQVLEYVDRQKIACHTDPSNSDPKWMRTRVRLGFIPWLERSVDSSIRARLTSIAELSREADEALTLRARQLDAASRRPARDGARDVRFDRERLAAGPATLQARVLRLCAAEQGVMLTRGATSDAVRFVRTVASGATMDLGGGLTLAREYGVIVVSRGVTQPPDRPVVIELGSAGAARLVLAGRRFEVRWGAHQAGLKRGHRIALPTGGSHYPMSIRARRSGDRIRLPGGTRSLKRLFSDRQIPLSDRPAVPVLVDASGDVLWVAGVANDTRLGDVRETGGHMVVEIDEVLS